MLDLSSRFRRYNCGGFVAGQRFLLFAGTFRLHGKENTAGITAVNVRPGANIYLALLHSIDELPANLKLRLRAVMKPEGGRDSQHPLGLSSLLHRSQLVTRSYYSQRPTSLSPISVVLGSYACHWNESCNTFQACYLCFISLSVCLRNFSMRVI